jgi:dipeptidyl aminopeptidase/acylaminoacyl peptidase
VIVKAHGGPTAWARAGFELENQFWTNRGFAVVDVNYRGSTGLGRAYRQALQGRWGDLDIDDVTDVVKHLAQTGRASADGLFIRGGSAGGYVVLRALTRDPEIWAGGACRYGIGNIGTLAATTHKFEARYLDGLLGLRWEPGMENQPGNPYHDRSPIFFIDQMKAPVVLFQGSDDQVVPPNVSREMVETLQAAGVPTEYHEYQGEGHGFRKAENRVHSLEAELRFFQGVLEQA